MKNQSEKAYLGDGAVLELAGDSRELRELGGLRREMRVRMSVERSDRCLSRTTRSRTILRERLLHTFSSSNTCALNTKKKEKKRNNPTRKVARRPRALPATRERRDETRRPESRDASVRAYRGGERSHDYV